MTLLQVWDAVVWVTVVVLCMHSCLVVLFLLNNVVMFLIPPSSPPHTRSLRQTIQIGGQLPTDSAELMKNLGESLGQLKGFAINHIVKNLLIFEVGRMMDALIKAAEHGSKMDKVQEIKDTYGISKTTVYRYIWASRFMAMCPASLLHSNLEMLCKNLIFSLLPPPSTLINNDYAQFLSHLPPFSHACLLPSPFLLQTA